MVDLVKIYFGPEAATARAVEYDKAMIVCDGSEGSLTQSKIYELTSDDWETQLLEDGFDEETTIYNSVSTFFSCSPVPERLFVFAYVATAEVLYEDVPLEYVYGNIWQIPIRPPNNFYDDIEVVEFFGKASDLQALGTENFADGSVGIGFTVETDLTGKWTGRLEFTNGLSGDEVGVIKPLTTDCKVLCSFEADEKGALGKAIKDNRINFIGLSLENSAELENYSDNIFGSQVEDLRTVLSAISGKNTTFIYATPGGFDPEGIITGTSTPWKNLKDLIGANEHFGSIKGKPSDLLPDVTAGYMAMIVTSHPHTPMHAAIPYFGLEEGEEPINQGKLMEGQISFFEKRSELTGSPYWLMFGYTFGAGNASRINMVRCRDIMAETVINILTALIGERTVLMSYDGMQTIKSRIKGAFTNLIGSGIIDGLRSVSIPIEDDLLNNTDAGILAREQFTVPGVLIEYELWGAVERILITRAENVS